MSKPHLVVTVGPCGDLHTLQKSGGLDLRSLGVASIRRISEVAWHEGRQVWFVQFLTGPLQGRKVDAADAARYSAEHSAEDTAGGFLGFREYADAVALEVAIVEAAQRKGEGWIKHAMTPTARPGILRRLLNLITGRR